MKCHNVRGGARKGASRNQKKAAALALCVSLWMAGGSVASAGELYLNVELSNTLYDDGSGNPANVDDIMSTTGATSITGSGTQTLSITGGDNWNAMWNFYGGYAANGSSVDGYRLELTNVHQTTTGIAWVWGGKSNQSYTTNNTVTVYRSSVDIV